MAIPLGIEPLGSHLSEMRKEVWGAIFATDRCVSPRRSRLVVIVEGGIPSLNIESHNVIKQI